MPDLLTDEECVQICSMWGGEYAKLQAAARLGAERERERAARVLQAYTDDKNIDSFIRGFARACAAAIRRGEGE